MSRPATGARERVLTATLNLLRQGGLSAAGLNEVVALARSPKGSLYHYFPGGKQQLVAEALSHYRAAVAAQIGQALQGRTSLRHRVMRLFSGVEQRMASTRFSQSCAVGAVVLDLAPGDDELRRICGEALAHWAATAAEHLGEVPAAHRLAVGRMLVNQLEGAELLARAVGHGGPLKEAALAFVAYAQTYALTTVPAALPATHRQTAAARRRPTTPRRPS
jgi:TetR/AcrR family transcriptional regulator, lmrAB and yxaGH operons repressor